MSLTVRWLSRLEVVSIDDQLWQLTAPLDAELDYGEGRLERIVVPTGFVTDFASVPRLPLVYLATAGVGERAAVLHDFCYSVAEYQRSECDRIFRAALEGSGVSWFQRWAMWSGVRAGGSRHYGSNARARKSR
jgi:hypothetical protein